MRYLRRVALALTAMLVVGVPSALGQDDIAGQVYGDAGGGIEGDIAGAGSAGGSLPFTGLDLAFIVIGGLALLAVGVLLRLRSRPERG
jgi:hypothetical protein